MFGGSKRRGNPQIKVIVPRDFIGPVYTCSGKTNKLMSAIVGIYTSGRMLKLGIITDREQNIEMQMSAHFIHQFFTMNREIFENFLSWSVIPYIENIRKELNYFTSLAAIILDDHTSHLSMIAKSYVAKYTSS